MTGTLHSQFMRNKDLKLELFISRKDPDFISNPINCSQCEVFPVQPSVTLRGTED